VLLCMLRDKRAIQGQYVTVLSTQQQRFRGRCDGWALSCAWHTQVLSRLVGLHTYNTNNNHQGQQGRAGHGCGFEVVWKGSLKLRYKQWLICW
jgi:hypothetical protein